MIDVPFGGKAPWEKLCPDGPDGHRRDGPAQRKDLYDAPSNIGNNTFSNTSVRSRITLHVIHMHRVRKKNPL